MGKDLYAYITQPFLIYMGGWKLIPVFHVPAEMANSVPRSIPVGERRSFDPHAVD